MQSSAHTRMDRPTGHPPTCASPLFVVQLHTRARNTQRHGRVGNNNGHAYARTRVTMIRQCPSIMHSQRRRDTRVGPGAHMGDCNNGGTSRSLVQRRTRARVTRNAVAAPISTQNPQHKTTQTKSFSYDPPP
jgi:hypothetical protein